MTIARTDLITDLRNFMRDKPELNRLIAGHETENVSLNLCIELAVEAWNMRPPNVATMSITSSGDLTVITHPSNTKYILVLGIMIQVLKSVLLLHGRNRMNYGTGGVAVNYEENVIASYLSYLNRFEAEYNLLESQYKMTANMSQLLDSGGGIGSDYSYYQTETERFED